jgi:hypothetical protein
VSRCVSVCATRRRPNSQHVRKVQPHVKSIHHPVTVYNDADSFWFSLRIRANELGAH